MDSIGSEVDDEINATAEVRATYNHSFLLIFFVVVCHRCRCRCRCVYEHHKRRKLPIVFIITYHSTFKHTGRILKRP